MTASSFFMRWYQSSRLASTKYNLENALPLSPGLELQRKVRCEYKNTLDSGKYKGQVLKRGYQMVIIP